MSDVESKAKEFAEHIFSSVRRLKPDESTWQDLQYGRELSMAKASFIAGHAEVIKEARAAVPSAMDMEMEAAAWRTCGKDRWAQHFYEGALWMRTLIMARLRLK